MSSIGRKRRRVGGCGGLLAAMVVAGCAATGDDGDRPAPLPPAAVQHARGPVARLLTLPRRPGFEVNRGQWPAPVRYVARDGEATLFLTDTDAVWRLRSGSGPRADFVRLRWAGADPHAVVSTAGALPARVNYLRGGDPRHWQTDVPLFARVIYRDLYPGIDLVFHDERGALEYDLVVAPGADPGAIRLSIEGAERAALDTRGRLVLRVAGGEIVHQVPLVYQDGPGGRRRVAARYRVDRTAASGRIEVAFAVGEHDPAAPLVIDPSVAYSTEIDDATDAVVDAAADAQGNLWIAGTTTNAAFPVTPDAVQTTKAAFDAGYVAKLDARGQLVYATYLSGSLPSYMGGIDVDAAGNVYLAGVTLATDFPVTPGALQTVAPGGGGDGFLSKLGPDGQLLYSTYFGGLGAEELGARQARSARVRVAPDRSVYLLVSLTTSLEFPVPRGTRAEPGDGDAFVARLDGDFTPLWGVFLGGSASDFGIDLAADGDGNAFVYGATAHIFGQPQDFPTTPGAFQERNDLDQSHFVVKLAPTGDVLAATLFGPPTGAEPLVQNGALTVDGAGNPYLAVVTGAANLPATPGAYQSMRSGFSDFFVAAFDPTLSTLRYGTYLGGTRAEKVTGGGLIARADAGGRLWVGGVTESGDYPLRDPLPTVPTDQVLSRLGADGATLEFSTSLPVGTFALALGDGAAYVSGQVPNRLAVAAIRIDETTTPAACGGDCNDDRMVMVNELVLGVRIALGQDTVDACASFDADGDGTVVIAELIGAVRSALEGCA